MQSTLVEGAQAALEEMRQAAAAGAAYPLVLLDAHMPGTDGFMLAQAIGQASDLAGSTLVMLTSAGRSGDVARCEQLGIHAYLMKPVKQSDLLNTILQALERTHQKRQSSDLLPSASPLGGEALGGREVESLPGPARSLRVLLVEDSPINQKLGLRLLEKQGHQVVVADNGLVALERLNQEQFDLVLMDVQMPELDGLEATKRLRSQEAGSGRRVPVLAMTARAMKGDRERCLESGMDGYLTKPIRPQELFDAIASVLATSETTCR
jgi:CheY-like chemotaxis protein